MKKFIVQIELMEECEKRYLNDLLDDEDIKEWKLVKVIK